MNLDASVLAASMLAAFAAVSFYDGVVVHFFLERLPWRPASQLEHRLHTARALLFPAILASFFAGSGPLLVGWGLLALDQALEVWDMAVERRSRTHTGGLKSSEYVTHGVLTTLRTAAVAFTATIDRTHTGAGAGAAGLASLVSVLLPGAILAAVAHLVLAMPRSRAWFSFGRRLA